MAILRHTQLEARRRLWYGASTGNCACMWNRGYLAISLIAFNAMRKVEIEIDTGMR